MSATAETPAEGAPAEAASEAIDSAAAATEVAKDAASDVATTAESAADNSAQVIADAQAAVDSMVSPEETATPAADTGAQAPVQTVYVQAPQPPKQKGNRGFGILFAFLATLAYGAAFAGVGALLLMFLRPEGLATTTLGFLVSPFFYVPVATFFVLMILWALLVNRAGWWAWVLGSLLIAALTYGVSLAVFMFLAGGFSQDADHNTSAWNFLVLNPALIVATLLAREAALWFGGAVAKRGRKVRERNYAAWQAFEQEQAAKRG